MDKPRCPESGTIGNSNEHVVVCMLSGRVCEHESGRSCSYYDDWIQEQEGNRMVIKHGDDSLTLHHVPDIDQESLDDIQGSDIRDFMEECRKQDNKDK